MPLSLSFVLARETLDVIYINVWSILVSLANLLILYLILKRFLFKPVTRVVSQREERIQGTLSDAETARREAEEARLTYEARMARAEEDAAEVVRRATRTAAKAHEEIVAEARTQANALLDEARADIEQEKKKAVNALKNEISEISLSIAETVVGREVSEEDHRRLISTFTEEVGGGNE